MFLPDQQPTNTTSAFLPFNGFRPTAYFVSGPCGSGKTYALCQEIAENLGHSTNVLLVLPTYQLIDQVVKDLEQLGVQAKVITTRTHARARQAILLEFKSAPETGRVLLVTWSAYSLLPYVDRKNWTVFIDEIPPLEKAMTYKLPRHSSLLLDRLVISDCEFEGLQEVRAVFKDELKDLLRDEIDCGFRRNADTDSDPLRTAFR